MPGLGQKNTHNKSPAVRQTGSQSVTSQTFVLLGGCGGLHSRVYGACHMSVVGLSRVGEWSSGQATKRAWNRRLANYGCGD